jgi:hypothetical protein
MFAKLIGVVITLQACISEVLCLDLLWGTGYPEAFHDFPQSLQVNSSIVAALGNGCFFQRLSNLSIFLPLIVI